MLKRCSPAFAIKEWIFLKEASWKEYQEDEENVSFWLKWGGLIHPQVMQNKDYSLLSVIDYEPYQSDTDILQKKLPALCNGWVYWAEEQHIGAATKCYLVIYWNPFYSADNAISNYIIGTIKAEEACQKFLQVVVDIFNTLFEFTVCYILSYQSLVSFLEKTISVSRPLIWMPQVPMYFDALLTQDADIYFEPNAVCIGENKILILTMPPPADSRETAGAMDFFNTLHINYRHVQRLLIFSRKKAKEENKRFTRLWCSGRPSVGKFITENVLSELNGYYANIWLLSVPFAQEEEIRDKLTEYFTAKAQPYILENYNTKNLWWASLPGMYEPYAAPPIIGFSSLDDLLLHSGDEG